MTSDPKSLARDLLLLAELGKRVKAADLVARSAYAAAADVGDRAVWVVDDGRVGAVQLAAGATRVVVSDAAALLEWVRRVHPTEAVQAWAVRPAYQAALLEAVKAAGEPVDPATGEVVPGIRVETGPPSVRVVPDRGAGALVEAEWAAGRLALPAAVLPPVADGSQSTREGAQ